MLVFILSVILILQHKCIVFREIYTQCEVYSRADFAYLDWRVVGGVVCRLKIFIKRLYYQLF